MYQLISVTKYNAAKVDNILSDYFGLLFILYYFSNDGIIETSLRDRRREGELRMGVIFQNS